MKVLKQYWWLLLTFAIVTGIFLFKYDDLETLDWNMDDPTGLLGTVFAKLLIIGALLDQLIAVFFPQDDVDVESRTESMFALNLAKENKKMVKKELLNQRLSGINTEDQIGALYRMEDQFKTFDQSEKAARESINDIDSKRSAYVRRVAFAAGLVLAITGITVLSDFIDMSDKTMNHKILSYIDILFTAAVLSGGTSGIGQLLQIIKDSWKKS